MLPTSATQHTYEPNFVSRRSWTSHVTNKLLFTATAGVAWVTQIDYRGPDVTEQSIQITDTGLGIKYGAAYGATAGGSSYSTQPRRSFQQQFSAAYVTGEHAFNAGLALREAI